MSCRSCSSTGSSEPARNHQHEDRNECTRESGRSGPRRWIVLAGLVNPRILPRPTHAFAHLYMSSRSRRASIASLVKALRVTDARSAMVPPINAVMAAAIPLSRRASATSCRKLVFSVMKGLLEVGFDVDAGAVVGDLRKAEPLWRETGDGHGTTLVVTDAGLLAIGVETVVVKTMASIRQRAAQPPAPKPPTPRAGTKQAQIIAMLQRPRGASVAEMVEATSWQVHTVRGAISGALKKKLGLPIIAEKVEGKGMVYKLPA